MTPLDQTMSTKIKATTLQPRDCDVLFGRGDTDRNHEGNIAYRKKLEWWISSISDIRAKRPPPDLGEAITYSAPRFFYFDPAEKRWALVHYKTIPFKTQEDFLDAMDEKETNNNGGKEAVPPFLHLLHRMLNYEKSCTDVEMARQKAIVSWQPHGRSFKIHDEKQFCEYILPKYFGKFRPLWHTSSSSPPKEINFEDFLCHLFMYGFVRIDENGHFSDMDTYYHGCFVRNKIHLSRYMCVVKERCEMHWGDRPALPDFNLLAKLGGSNATTTSRTNTTPTTTSNTTNGQGSSSPLLTERPATAAASASQGTIHSSASSSSVGRRRRQAIEPPKVAETKTTTEQLKKRYKTEHEHDSDDSSSTDLTKASAGNPSTTDPKRNSGGDNGSDNDSAQHKAREQGAKIHQAIRLWLTSTAIGSPDIQQMDQYAKKFVDLGLDSVEMIQRFATKEEVNLFDWMKPFHKRAFLEKAGLKGK